MDYNSYPQWYTKALDQNKESPVHTVDPKLTGVTFHSPPPTRRGRRPIPPPQKTNDRNTIIPGSSDSHSYSHDPHDDPHDGNKKSSATGGVLDMIESASGPLLNLATPTRQSAQEPARILAALDKAATPLLETVRAMIEVVDNQPLTDMLEKLFSFFDIVIRAARKSAGLYADVIQQQEIEQARAILNASLSQIDDGHNSRYEQLFHRLLDISLRVMKTEREHSSLLQFCRASSSGSAVKYGEMEEVEDGEVTGGVEASLVESSLHRTKVTRRDYLKSVKVLKKQLAQLLLQPKKQFGTTILDDRNSNQKQTRAAEDGSGNGEKEDQFDEEDQKFLSSMMTENVGTITVSTDDMQRLQQELITLRSELKNRSTQADSNRQQKQEEEETSALNKNIISKLQQELALVKEQREHAETQRDAAVQANRNLRNELRDHKMALHAAPSPPREGYLTERTEIGESHQVGVAMLEKKVQKIEEEHKQRGSPKTKPTHRSRASSVLAAVQGALDVGQQSMASSTGASISTSASSGDGSSISLNDVSSSSTLPMSSQAAGAQRSINLALRRALSEKEAAITVLKNQQQKQSVRLQSMQAMHTRIHNLVLSKSMLENECATLQQKYDSDSKKWKRKSEMIGHLQQIATNADRSRMKAVDTMNEEKQRTKQLQSEYGPEFDKLKKIHAQTLQSLERARGSRSTLMTRIQSMEVEMRSFDMLSSEHAQLLERVADAEIHDAQRNKLLASLEKKLTVCRIQLHQQQQQQDGRYGTESSYGESLSSSSKSTNGPFTPKKHPFVSSLSPAATHNVKMRGGGVGGGASSPGGRTSFSSSSSSSSSSPSSVAATAAATAAHAARELQRKLSAARNTIVGLKQREADVVQKTEKREAEQFLYRKEHDINMERIKDRLQRGEENFRKVRHAKILLEKKVRHLEQRLEETNESHENLKDTVKKKAASSHRARTHMVQQLGKARAANAANTAMGNDDDDDDNGSSSSSSSSGAYAIIQPKTKLAMLSVQEHVAASLLHALGKMKIGATRNVHGRGSHVDLRGFRGEEMSLTVFVREIRSQLGVRLTENESTILFYYFDKDHGGTVSFVEILFKLQRPNDLLVMSDRDAMTVALAYMNFKNGSVSSASENKTAAMENTYVPDALQTAQASIIDLDAVEQLRLRLRQQCTTFKGLEPKKTFNKWDKNHDQELSRVEVREGMEKMMGADVVSEWKMFDHFFDYVDIDNSGVITVDEFDFFVRTKPTRKILRKKTDKHERPSSFFSSFAKNSGTMSAAGKKSTKSPGRSPSMKSRKWSAKKLKQRAHSKVDDHQSKGVLQRAKGHHHDYVHERGAGKLSAFSAPDVKHAHEKVDDHQSAGVMKATLAHEQDYVHDRAPIAAPDVKHAHSKVDDHQSAGVMKATLAHEQDYVHDRAPVLMEEVLGEDDAQSQVVFG